VDDPIGSVASFAANIASAFASVRTHASRLGDLVAGFALILWWQFATSVFPSWRRCGLQ